MTNQGLEFQVSCYVPFEDHELDGSAVSKDERLPLALNCWRDGVNGPLAITIVFFNYGGIWHRIECDKLELSKPVNSMSDSGLAKYTALIYIIQGGV